MDNNFQTSFIPKKALSEERTPRVSGSSSLLSFLATILFFTSLAAAVGTYFYKATLSKNIVSMQSQLISAGSAFEPKFITTLHTLDKRISNANILLNNHVSVSPIFDALQIGTLKSIQFTKFSYVAPSTAGSPITVTMSGKARDYTSIALESDQLALNKNIHNSIFSNLTLDDTTGLVGFDLVFTVDQDLVKFASHLDAFSSGSSTATDTTLSTNTVNTDSSNNANPLTGGGKLPAPQGTGQ